MLVDLISIGSDKGIKLPQKLIDQCHIQSKIQLIVSGTSIIIQSAQVAPRLSWEKFAKQMHACHDDDLLIDDVFVDEEFPEWS